MGIEEGKHQIRAWLHRALDEPSGGGDGPGSNTRCTLLTAVVYKRIISATLSLQYLASVEIDVERADEIHNLSIHD